MQFHPENGIASDTNQLLMLFPATRVRSQFTGPTLVKLGGEQAGEK